MGEFTKGMNIPGM